MLGCELDKLPLEGFIREKDSALAFASLDGLEDGRDLGPEEFALESFADPEPRGFEMRVRSST